MLKTIFYEVAEARIAGSFSIWLVNKGYKAEGNTILEVLVSWADKEATIVRVTCKSIYTKIVHSLCTVNMHFDTRVIQ